jgi:hypothetical protein
MMKAPDQLATIGEHGRRMKVYPADVKGKYRSRKNILYVILLAIFLSLPWIRIAGEPAVLFDLATRKFALFGVVGLVHRLFLLTQFFGESNEPSRATQLLESEEIHRAGTLTVSSVNR